MLNIIKVIVCINLTVGYLYKPCTSFSFSPKFERNPKYVGVLSKNAKTYSSKTKIHMQNNENNLHHSSQKDIHHDINRRSAYMKAIYTLTFLNPYFFLSASKPKRVHAFENDSEPSFVGTYSDPINHPGGTRSIRLLQGKKIGDYQLAEVEGGGGRGEPKQYVLPAIIIGDRAIIIDFSPKGGPKDFTGVLDGKDIKFIRDGNRWPRID